MARMTGIENDAGAAGQPRAEPGSADENERRYFGVDTKPIERLPSRIARRHPARTGNGEADKPRGAIEAAAELGQRGSTQFGLKMNQIADDYIRVSLPD